MKSVSDLRVQIFADGADKASMLELYRQPHIKGFTTNPTLMRAIGSHGLSGLRAGSAGNHSGPSHLVRSICR